MSRSGYYAWQRRQDHPSQRQLARARLDQLVSEAFAARKGRSGAVGLTLDLDELGHKYNRKTVAASMKRQGLVAKAAKKYKATTDSDHNLPVHTLKVEMVHGESFATREAMRRAVFEYIEVDYNRTRRHSANGHISPVAFENKMAA